MNQKTSNSNQLEKKWHSSEPMRRVILETIRTDKQKIK